GLDTAPGGVGHSGGARGAAPAGSDPGSPNGRPMAPRTESRYDDNRQAKGSDYAALLRQVKDGGLLGRRRGYYVTRMAVTGGLLLAGWAAFVGLGDSWWQLLVAVYLAVVFTQLGFLGHDAGH